MERKVTKLENSHVEVEVVVEKSVWEAAQKKAFDKALSNVEVKGFRKGKAPVDLAKSKVNQVKVMDDAINGLLPEIYRDILTNENLRPMAQPKVDVTKLSDTELEVKFVIVCAPEVTLGNYKGLKIGHGKVEVSGKEVEEALLKIQKDNASLVLKEDVASLGDTVVLDFVGTIDGKAFDGGSAKNHELELGSHTFIPGFEEQLVGKKAGEHVDVNVTFPENYTPELKGKAAVFACDIHEVKEKKLPELDEELVKDLKLDGVTTVEQLKDHKKAELKANKEAQERREYMGKVLEAITKDSKIEVADEILDQQVESRKADIVNRMSQSGLTLEQYLNIVGQKEEDFLAKLKEESKKDVVNFLVMEKIAEVEHLEVTDADLEFEYAKMADQYKMKIEDVKKALSAQAEEFRHNVKMGRVEEFLLINNN